MEMIPFTALTQYPAFLSDGARADGSAPEITLRPIERFTLEHRATLVDAIAADLKSWGAPGTALESAECLRLAGSYAVVTGQQAGLATGPLYTIYKAVGAIRTAAALALRYPEHRFVPVFWIESDDHDFDEVRTIGVIDRAGTHRTIEYDDGDRTPRHVGERRVDVAAFEQVIDALRGTLIETEFSPEASELLRAAYLADDATLASGFARTIYGLLGDTPLVVVSSRNPRLKWLAADVMTREIQDPAPLYDAVRRRTEERSAAGLPVPIAAKPGALFLSDKGLRRPLEPIDGGYRFRDTSETIERSELMAIAEQHPERLSPNVVLRPIVQDAIFPTATYLGGPGELAYLQQVEAGYQLFGIDPPSFLPRPFVLLLEHKVRRALESSHLKLEHLLVPEFNAGRIVVEADQEEAIESAREEVLEGLRSALKLLEPLTTAIDPTLEKALAALRAQSEKGVDDFARRLRSALKRRHQTEIDRLEAARELIMPAGHLQERSINPLYFVNKYGLERFRNVLGEIEAFGSGVQVIEV